MSNIVIKDFFLTLAWIKSDENHPTSFDVVFALKKSDTKQICKYVSFTFNSYDLMNVYLKSLAKQLKTHSIDSLFYGEFLVEVKYSENFNSYDTFESMYVNSNVAWPIEKYPHAHFKIETFV